MNYEQWRITFQSSEQAARAAYSQLAECQRERDMLRKFHHDQQELHERNEANAQTNRLRLLQIVELRAACQMALDEFESRKRDTEEEGYMYIESVAHAKLREVLK